MWQVNKTVIREISSKKIIGSLLILVGIILISTALFKRYEGYNKQQQMINYFEQSYQQDKSETEGKNQIVIQKPPYQELEGAIGLIIIPKIDLKVAIGEGVDDETLKYAVGHFKDTGMPGEKGNFCIAGHRSYTYNEYFNRLDELTIGDTIIIKTRKEEFSYKIYEKKVVEPTEISVLDPTEDATITLVTCTPIRVATHRLIIKGKL